MGRHHAFAAITLFACAGGCEAYNKAAYAVLDRATVVSGHVKVINTMSVAVCGATMVPAGVATRDGNELNGKVLAPGAEGQVDFPYIGKPSENLPQPEVWTMRVYGCASRTAYSTERGALLATIADIHKDAGSVSIH